MKIGIIGSGAREHAIAKVLARSKSQPQLYCFGNVLNPGIKTLTTEYWLGDITDCEAVLQKLKQAGVELAIIGPEAPLEKGMADVLWAADIPTIGPKKQLAQLETSKKFTRDLMQKYQIPGLPRYRKFPRFTQETIDFLHDLGEGNYVIKANGLMSGKGVKLAGEHLHCIEDARNFCEEIISKEQNFIVEEKLRGQEFSFMCFADGKTLVPMPLVQDHKRVFEGDKGENTGGMGSYSDKNFSLPFLSAKEVEDAFAINQAVYQALTKEFTEKYIGILYGGFMATRAGVYVIEFNARFGDPEALNVLSILKSDFVTICQAMINGNLTAESVEFYNKSTVCKYVVPQGYPNAPLKDFAVDFSKISSQTNLYFSAVNFVNNQLLATGARTAAYVGIADDIFAAEQEAEETIALIEGPLFHRRDIGTFELIQSRIDDMERLRWA